MRSVAIGGNSRNVGKTGLAASIIAATRDLGWTAVKIAQFGHGICSRDGEPCGCAVADPRCPFEISEEDGSVPGTDTARLLAAGAAEVLWLRVALGQLGAAIPELGRRLRGRGSVLFESNSIVDHWRPDAYLSVLQCDIEDCKESARRLAQAADAFVMPPSERAVPTWDEFDPELLNARPVFRVQPPSYCTREVVNFVRERVA